MMSDKKSENEMRRNIEAFNEMFGFHTDVCEGSMTILKKSWDSVKAYLNSKTISEDCEKIST